LQATNTQTTVDLDPSKTYEITMRGRGYLITIESLCRGTVFYCEHPLPKSSNHPSYLKSLSTREFSSLIRKGVKLATTIYDANPRSSDDLGFLAKHHLHSYMRAFNTDTDNLRVKSSIIKGKGKLAGMYRIQLTHSKSKDVTID